MADPTTDPTARPVDARTPDAPGAARGSGSLYVVATPIGNLSDLSQRASVVLRNVTWWAAEDTRVSRTLAERIGAQPRWISAHQHNEQAATERILATLTQGDDVALISDAGTPAISDPGATIVAATRANGHPVVPIPGASAPIALLSAAGLPPGPFLFEGFLPARDAMRTSRLSSLREHADALGAHLVLFEAPHRIAATLRSLREIYPGQRPLVIGRELTKRFEEIHRMPLDQALEWLQAEPNRLRGEYVLAIGAPSTDAGSNQGTAVDATLTLAPALREATALMTRLLEDLPASRAARLAQALTGLPRKPLYELALKLKPMASSNLADPVDHGD